MIHHDMIRFQNVTKMYLWFFLTSYGFRDTSYAAANQKGLSQNGVPDSLNESQCNSIVIVLLRSASVIGPEIVISELFQFNSLVIFREKISSISIVTAGYICPFKMQLLRHSLDYLAYLQRL